MTVIDELDKKIYTINYSNIKCQLSKVYVLE